MPTAKLTDAQVLAIRTSNQTVKQLAKRYGVDHSVISRIQTGETYMNAPGPIRDVVYKTSKSVGRPSIQAAGVLSDDEATVISCLRFAEHLSVDEILLQSQRDRSGLVSWDEANKVLVRLHRKGFVERRTVTGRRGRLHRMTRAGLDAWIAAGRPWQEADLVA